MHDLLEKWDRQLSELTNTQAVAVTFSRVRPTGVSRELIPQPSGCSFWKLAAEGQAFYAEASDHFGCTMGAYVFGAELPAPQAEELATLTSAMIKLSYIKIQEVKEIPRRIDPLCFVLYTPLGLSPALPDLVLVKANSRYLMLLAEAARATGFFTCLPAMGRPACAIVPQSLVSGQVILSLGCIGNRIYTGLGDQEGYLAIPGNALEPICTKLAIVLEANETLGQFHRQKYGQFTATA